MEDSYGVGWRQSIQNECFLIGLLTTIVIHATAVAS